jgi:cbb3-type cytochrome oxidase maturation protein
VLALLWLVPVTLLLGLGALWLYGWAVRSGQFEDLDAEAHRILRDD